MQILCRRSKNNPLYVGEPGVGKTAIAEGLAKKIVEKAGARGAERGGDLLARHGRAARRHPLSRRLRGAVEGRSSSELEKLPHAVLFIDEIHTVIGAGATSGGAMDASNLLKPALSGGSIRCIGSTTYKEFRNHFEKDRALLRRFQKIDVNEPTRSRTRSRSSPGCARATRSITRSSYTPEAIKAAVELSSALHQRPQVAR